MGKKPTALVLALLLMLGVSGGLAASAATPGASVVFGKGSPSSVIVASDGALLISDTASKVIWRLAPDEEPVVLVGRDGELDVTGLPSGGYDDDKLTGAALMEPWGMTRFLGGYVVSDTANNVIRYFDKTRVYTAAGSGEAGYRDGSGELAAFNGPTGVATDDKGNVYIADTGNNCIRIMDTSGRLTTYAGGARGFADGALRTAAFREPTGLAWHDGALYVADSGNHAIRMIKGGEVTTIAGAKYDPESDEFVNGGYLDGPAVTACFSSPQGVAVAQNGAVLVADTGNSAVRMIKDSVVTTFMMLDKHSGETYPVAPRGLLVRGNTLYITDVFAGVVMRTLISRDASLYGDVNQGGWYVPAINFVLQEGLFQGTGDDTFSPNAPMTRGMLVTVLSRLYKNSNPSVAIEGKTAFTDVESGKYYTNAVMWAADSAIVTGSGGLFRPDDAVTRDEMAVILYRFAAFAGLDTTSGRPDALDGFVDKNDVSPWAVDAMAWAVSTGLMKGLSPELLCPRDISTRAQVAQLFLNIKTAL